MSFLANLFFKSREKVETLRLIFGEVFVLFTYELFQENTFFEVPPPLLGRVAQHTHVQNF